MVERWFAELTTKKINRGSHTSVRALEKDIRECTATWNDDAHPYVWHKTAEQIFGAHTNFLNRYLPTIGEEFEPDIEWYLNISRSNTRSNRLPAAPWPGLTPGPPTTTTAPTATYRHADDGRPPV